MHNRFIRYSSFAVFAGLLVLAVGCGSAGSQQLVGGNIAGSGSISSVTTSSCGTYNLNSMPCSYGFVRTAGGTCMSQYGSNNNDFPSRCQASGGSAVNGSVCRFLKSPDGSFSGGGSPVLNPGVPCGGLSVGLAVKPGDKLTISGVTGKWGTLSYDVHQSGPNWFPITTTSMTSSSCQQISATGWDSVNNVQTTYNGVNAGIVASDGVNVFAVGTGIANQVISADGMLRIGLNIPTNLQSMACSSTGLWVNSISVVHCEDASGNTVSCP